MRRAIAAAALAAWTTGSAWAEVLSFDFNSNEVGTRNRGARGSVLLVGEPGQTATIGSLAGFSESVELDSRGFYELQVPSSHQQSGIGVWSSGFQVASPKPIAGYFINRRMFSTDMTYLLDSRALGTDYLDIFLLHEPDWSNLPTDEIVASAEKLKRQGKIRAFGAAFYREEKMPTEAEGNVFDLLQFDCPRAGSVYDLVEKERGGMANVIFSPSRAGFVGLDFTDVLARLWADFPRSVVLSSMFDPDHIRANAAKAAL